MNYISTLNFVKEKFKNIKKNKKNLGSQSQVNSWPNPLRKSLHILQIGTWCASRWHQTSNCLNFVLNVSKTTSNRWISSKTIEGNAKKAIQNFNISRSWNLHLGHGIVISFQALCWWKQFQVKFTIFKRQQVVYK